MVGLLIIEETKMKDVNNQTTNKGGRTITYAATFWSKSGTPIWKIGAY
jgi:hypothetical protein